MKLFVSILFLFTFSLIVFGQTETPLATAKDISVTLKMLAPETQNLYGQRDKLLADKRAELLADMVIDTLLETESAAAKKSTRDLIAEATQSMSAPTAAEIKAVYDAARAEIGNKTLEETTPQIINYLRNQAGLKLIDIYLGKLKTKYKFTSGKDINAKDLKPADVVFSITAKPVTFGDFLSTNKVAINDFELELADAIAADIEETLFGSLIAAEAKSKNVDTGDLIATEITNKMKEYTEAERVELLTALRKRLFAAYGAKVLFKKPEALAQTISVDDDPALGSATAPVTVVMFTDLQCPACKATDPELKKVIAEYGTKIRFVVRDFPLESIHENAFNAAVAANAANAQGKFFEFIDMLYQNQNALTAADLVKYATAIGLNVKQFEIDLANPKNADEVRKDIADGRIYGVASTPTIFINGVKVRNLSESDFRDAIENAIGKK